MTTDIDALLKLPVDERLEIIERIWESFQTGEDTDIPGWHREILNERFNKHKNNLTEGNSWDEVKKKLLQL